MNDTQGAGAGMKLERIGQLIVRYGLAIVVGWIGALKYTEYEGKEIEGLLVKCPFISWAYHLMGLRILCSVIGTTEILIAILLALRYIAPKISILGGVGAIAMFLTTVSFLFTTPGALQPEGFPYLSGAVGEFLIKDLVLLGAALWMTGDSLRASILTGAAAKSGERAAAAYKLIMSWHERGVRAEDIEGMAGSIRVEYQTRFVEKVVEKEVIVECEVDSRHLRRWAKFGYIALVIGCLQAAFFGICLLGQIQRTFSSGIVYVKDIDRPLSQVSVTNTIDATPNTSSYRPMNDLRVALHILSPEHMPATVTPAESGRYVILGPSSFSRLRYLVVKNLYQPLK
jgi:uncharacterized membrane protein YkgB